MSKLFPLLVIVLLHACKPTAVVTTHSKLEPIKEYESFLIFKENEPFAIAANELGEVKIKDGGLAVNCSYEAVVKMATAEAKQLGANCLRIYEHRLPSMFGSSCHRIKAKAYKIADVLPYEKEIIWHKQRKLSLKDFKGSTIDRPFEAATNSQIRYEVSTNLIKQQVAFEVYNVFDCNKSYFKIDTDSALTLLHEQGHFDITEIFARKLRQALESEINSFQDVHQKTPEIYNRILTECQTIHDKYDSDTYLDRTRQEGWLTKIEADLNSLEAFQQKNRTIKLKKQPNL